MPQQVRIISRRNSPQWDDLVRDAIRSGRLKVEHDYYGCATEERADEVRKKIRTAAKHQGHGAKVYYKPCPAPGKCTTGGPDCTHHVYYTIYDLDEARTYKAKQSAQKS